MINLFIKKNDGIDSSYISTNLTFTTIKFIKTLLTTYELTTFLNINILIYIFLNKTYITSL